MKQRKTKHLRFVLQWTRDLIRRNRAELTKIEEAIKMWKQRYSESVKMLNQLLIQKNKLTAELKDSLRLYTNHSRKYRSKIIRRTGPAHVGHNHDQELSDWDLIYNLRFDSFNLYRFVQFRMFSRHFYFIWNFWLMYIRAFLWSCWMYQK